MKPYPIQDNASFEALLGTVKAGFPSPADDFREKLEGMGVVSAWDYTRLPETTVRTLLHLPGFRTWKELRGMTTLSLNRNFSTAVLGNFRTFAYMKEPRVYNGIERSEFTPERISELRPDEVFVFGSNLEGMHGGGAAWVAFQKFGAVLGCGVGYRGQSYAIPTMQGGVETIKPYVDEFVSFAAAHPELFFYVTRIGCGIAGFKEKEIAPLFADVVRLENVCLPEGFAKLLIGK